MATRFRRDLTPEDFRIVKRFKHHQLRLILSGAVKKLPTPENGQLQMWQRSGANWIPAEWRNTDGPFIAIYIQDFRRIVRAIGNDIPSVSEGLVIATLRKFSLMIHTDDKQWKWRDSGGQAYIVLEYERLSQSGVLGKRNPDSAKSKLVALNQQIKETMEQMGWDFEKALQYHAQQGVTLELLEELLNKTRKSEILQVSIRQETDKKIKDRNSDNGKFKSKN